MRKHRRFGSEIKEDRTRKEQTENVVYIKEKEELHRSIKDAAEKTIEDLVLIDSRSWNSISLRLRCCYRGGYICAC